MNTSSSQPNAQLANTLQASGARQPYMTPVLINYGRLANVTQQTISGGAVDCNLNPDAPECQPEP